MNRLLMTDAKKTAADVSALLEETDKMRGLGDAVARVTKRLGIRECEPCAKRRQALNSMVPFGAQTQPKKR